MDDLLEEDGLTAEDVARLPKTPEELTAAVLQQSSDERPAMFIPRFLEHVARAAIDGGTLVADPVGRLYGRLVVRHASRADIVWPAPPGAV